MSRDFSGTAQYITMGDNMAFDRTDPFSICCWIYPDSVTSTKVILSKQDKTGNKTGYYFATTGANLFINHRSDNSPSNQISVTGSQTIVISTWTHVIVTYSGSSAGSGMNFYVDGVLDGSPSIGTDTLSGAISDATQFQLSGIDGNNNMFDGRQADVRVYNRAITQAEATELASGKQNTILNGLIGYFPSEGNDTIAMLDRSGSGFNGTNTSTTQSTNSPRLFRG